VNVSLTSGRTKVGAARRVKVGGRRAFTVRITRRAAARLRRSKAPIALRATAQDAGGSVSVRTVSLKLRR
jgi:hypothetical protein